MSPRATAILGSGMMTAVGLSAAASAAAIRCGIDNVQETRFIARDGEWIMASEVPLAEPWRGRAKLVRLLAGALEQCFALVPEVPRNGIPVILAVAEEGRPGRLEGLGNPLYFEVCERLGMTANPASRILAQGRVGGAVAMRQAGRLIREDGADRVIVAGVDSYLVGATLAAFDERERLLTAENSDGFIPGEAAAAVILGAPAGNGGLVALGLGFAEETATIDSEEPLRGDGLAAAIGAALADAGLAMADLDWRITDLSGEQYAFKEASLALARLLRERKEEFDLWHPADCVGEIGAAALPCMLAVADFATRKGYAPGPRVLAHLGNDDGKRAALVLAPGAEGG